MHWQIVGVFVGSALGGSFAAGEPVTVVATALQGSIGVTLGYAVGQYVQPLLEGKDDSKMESSIVPYLPWIGAAIVPLVTGGVVDRGLIGLLVGAKIGTILAPQ